MTHNDAPVFITKMSIVGRKYRMLRALASIRRNAHKREKRAGMTFTLQT